MRRSVALLGLPLMMIVAGCAPAGTGQAGPDRPSDSNEAFDQRATAVAEAWQPGTEWSRGYVPLQESTVLVGDPEFTAATQTAFLAGWYRNQAGPPARPPADGTIRFSDGELRVPLISAAEAYRQLAPGDPPPCPGSPVPATPPPAVPGGPDDSVTGRPQGDHCVPLTVTKIELGVAPLRTSRGEAQVPAWLFTVPEINAVIARVAVAPGAVGALPEPTPPSGPVPADLVTAQDIQAVDGATLTYRLGIGSCDTGTTPLVQEHDHVVIVGGTVVRATGGCNDMLNLEPVEVTLKAPLGARPVLDVINGTPLRLAAASPGSGGY
ncbi:hypothetical protein ACQPYA_05875 [Micromonospora sp. CA-263727]|uniref:hypothetical protein n=1 Tax=Micromonospora sp. CA-263727 TaxID=3239967 RepID=UPI003D8D24E7